MKRLIFLSSVIACSACAAEPGEPQAARPGMATQLTVPAPDYAAMDFSFEGLPKAEMSRDASVPPPPDAKAVGDMWMKRLSDAGHLGGAGLAGKGPDGAVQMMDILLTAEQFDAWVAEQGGGFPRHIDLRFQNSLVAPAVSAEVDDRIRYWPASKRRTGMQNMAALGGRVIVDDGCFYYIGWSDPPESRDKLAWFLMETGLDADEEGYLILVDRNTGHLQARVGEEMGWAGPNEVVITDAQKAALFEACGEHEIVSVGNPQASAKTYIRYPHLRPERVIPRPGEALPPAPPAEYPPPAPPPPPPED